MAGFHWRLCGFTPVQRKTKRPKTRFESWDARRSALPQVLLNYRLDLSGKVRNGLKVLCLGTKAPAVK